MKKSNNKSIIVLGLFIFLGLSSLGYFLSSAAIKYKEYERTVSVKGLSQKDIKADLVLWPIKFTLLSNDLNDIYSLIEKDTSKITKFLKDNGITKDEITIYNPNVIDKLADRYSSSQRIAQFRYIAYRTITVYSKNVDKVRRTISKLPSLGKAGISLSQNTYENKVEYYFTKLTEVKPSMIEESTKNARAVALKFAKDSSSKLGKIKKARQGQFSISSRDKNTEHIKRVRVVSSIEYYLSD